MRVLKKYWLIVAFGVVLFLGIKNMNVVTKQIHVFQEITSPIFLGFMIAFVLNILMEYIEERFITEKLFRGKFLSGIRRPVSLIITYTISIGFLVMVIIFVIPPLTKSTASLLGDMPVYAQKIGESGARLYERLGTNNQFVEQVLMAVKNSVLDVTKFTASAVSRLAGMVVAVTNIALKLLLALFFSIYMLASKEKHIDYIRRLHQTFVKEKWQGRTSKFAEKAEFIFRKFVGGEIIVAVILGLLCFIGMLIFRIPYAHLVSVIIALTSLIPYVGGVLGSIPSIFIIALTSVPMAITFTIFITILQQVNGSFISPKVMGDSIGLDGLWVMIAITIGGGLFGIPGMLFGVPLVAVGYSLMDEYMDHAAGEKTAPTGDKIAPAGDAAEADSKTV